MRSLLQRHRLIALLAYLLIYAVASLWAQAPGAPSNVTVNAGRATPTITSLSTASGAVGSTVVITGSGFSTTQGSGTVTFNGAAAAASSWSALSITVTVPAGATTGNLVVQQFGLSSVGTAFAVVTTDCGTAGCIYVDNLCESAGTGAVDVCGGATGRMTNLQTAISAATAGKVIVVHEGNDYVSTSGTGYTGASGFQFTTSGTAGNPITLRNAPGERPVLRGCTSASTTVAACDRATITLHNQSYITITSASCASNVSTAASLGLSVVGLIIAYDDGGATEGTYAIGNEISCTEVTRGYANLDDGNWSGIWLQAQNAATVRRNYIHDITVETLTGEGSQSSRSAIKTFGGVNSTIASNTIVNVAYSSANQYGIGFDCKADCVGNIFEKNLVLDTPTGWRIENQETPGGPYTTNGATGSTIRWNLFVSDGSAGVRECMHFEDGKITDVTFHNNTCVGYNEGLGENNHPSSNVCQGITSYNNAFVGTIDTNIKLSDGVGVSCAFTLSNYNRFTTDAAAPRFRYNATNYNALADWQVTGFDANSTEGTDASFLFTDAAGGDYTLQAGSPLQGTGSSGVDIGAYTDSVTILGCNCGVVTTDPPLSSYYVRPDGNNANTGTTNTAGGAWLTIAKCASTIVAGEVCRVQAGTYAEVVAETTSGTLASPITYVAEGAVTINGFSTTGDYIRIIGFTIDCAGVRGTAIDISNADFIEAWHNTTLSCIDDTMRTDGGSQVSQGHSNIFIGNKLRFSTFLDFQIRGNDNFLAYNESDAPVVDFLYLFGQRNRVINNYSHGINSDPASHTDFIQSGGGGDPLGLGQLLIEANFYADEFGSDHHCTNLEPNTAGLDAFFIFRRNVWISSGNTGQCYAFHSTQHDTKVYHETVVYRNLYNNFNRFGIPNRLAWLNIIFAPSWQFGVSPLIYDGAPSVNNYNLYYEPLGGSPAYGATVNAEANSQRNVNPLFTTPSSPTYNFTLQSTSTARDTGGALTTTSGSGTGTTFNVATGGGAYFRGSNAANLPQYSGNLVPGDIITVGTDVVQIASISTDAITVTSSFTWANGESVYLGTDTTPDIGAYPYKAGGYTLTATYACSGGTCTITPNDSTLVRFVVCFENGLPYAVDNASPYTCTQPSGTFSARAYPLYASKTLWAVATP
jgi:hypothetical protein